MTGARASSTPMTKPTIAIDPIATPPSGDAAPRAGRDPRVEADLARFAALDLDGLRKRWRKVVGRPAPDHLTRPLLHRMLAYRIQATAFGDLDRETTRQLDRLARCGAGEQDGGPSAAATDAIPLPSTPGTRPGTVLVREWRGKLQRVTVLERGFAWNSVDYDSLSKVARAITGTNWNGPRFFGLRAKGQSNPTSIGGAVR